MEKICIWCLKKTPQVNFNRPAHIFPQSLGGKRTCQLVCDDCNLYFGSKQTGLPSVEIAFKEPLNISRCYLTTQSNKKAKPPRFKSEYFDYDFSRQLIKPKNKYRLISEFQNTFAKQFKRGVFKVFLEERNESIGDALDPKFNFIREFARYGIGNYPVFYCKPNIPAILVSLEDIENPVIRFTDKSEEEMQQFGFYSYYFMSHVLAMPVIRTYELTMMNYIKYMLAGERPIYCQLISLQQITDLDFIFSYANPSQKNSLR